MVLSLILLMGLFLPMRVHAAGNVTISVSSSTLNIGDTVTVTAWATGPNGEKAIAKLGFNYDSGKLSFVSCSESSYSGGEGGYVGVSANTASITLKASAAGTAAVTVSGSDGVSVSDGTVEYGELTAGGTKLAIGSGTSTGQQDNGETADSTENANKSEDNSLASLKISPGTLSPAFQYSETNYTAVVGEDVTSVTVDAKPSNEKATIESITGQTDLQPGQNTISIVVKAENGVTATYKIIVTRGGAGAGETTAQENPEGDTQTPPAETSTENPEGITLNGHPFNLAAEIPEEVIPLDFTKTTVTCNGQQVEGLQFDKSALVLVYLTTPSTEVKNTLAVYEEASGTIYPFRKVELGENYLILLNPPAETGLSPEYTQTMAALAGFENVPVFINAAAVPAAASPAETDTGETANPEEANPEEAANPEGTDPEEANPEEAANPEGTVSTELAEFSLVYGASSYGNTGWYQYDAAENSFQRYVAQASSALEPSQESDDLDSSAELQGLQNAYKDLEEQFNEKKESSRRNAAIMIFVIAVLLVVIINLILRGRGDDEEEEEDDVLSGEPRIPLRKRIRRNREEDWDDDEEEEIKPIIRKKVSQETKPMMKPETSQKPEQSGAVRKPEIQRKPEISRKLEQPVTVRKSEDQKKPETNRKPETQRKPEVSQNPESFKNPDFYRKLEIPKKLETPKKVEPPKKMEPPKKAEKPKKPEKPVTPEPQRNLELDDDFEVIDLEDL